MREADPMMGSVYFWPLGHYTLIPFESIPSSVEEGESRLASVLESAKAEFDNKAAAFKNRREAFDEGDRVAEVKELLKSVKERSSVDDVAMEDAKVRLKTDRKVTSRTTEVEAGQMYSVVSFAHHVNADSGKVMYEGDAAFILHGVFATQEQADAFVSDAAKMHKHVDIVVAQTGVWLNPVLLSTTEAMHELPRAYHESKLDSIMKFHRTEQKMAETAAMQEDESGIRISEITLDGDDGE